MVTVIDEEMNAETFDVTPNEQPGVGDNAPATFCQRVIYIDGEEELCGVPLPLKGEEGYSRTRKYCGDHQPNKGNKSTKSPRPAKLPKSVELPSTPLDPKLKEMEKAAAFYLDFLPLVFGLLDDEVCAAALTKQVPAIARQIALLTKYHPALAKLLTPGESVGEAMAWGGLAIAASPAIIAILVHHNLVPEKMGELLGATFLASAAAEG